MQTVHTSRATIALSPKVYPLNIAVCKLRNFKHIQIMTTLEYRTNGGGGWVGIYGGLENVLNNCWGLEQVGVGK